MRVIREAFHTDPHDLGHATRARKPFVSLRFVQSGLESSCPLYRGSRSLLPPPRDRVSRTAAGCKALLPLQPPGRRSAVSGPQYAAARMLPAARSVTRRSPSRPSRRPCRSRSVRVRCRGPRAVSRASRECARRLRQTDVRSPHCPFTFILLRSIAPSGCASPSRSRQNSGDCHARSVHSTCASNASWNLVEVEVLQLQARVGEHARHRVRRRHQQTFLVDEVDCRVLAVPQVCEHR